MRSLVSHLFAAAALVLATAAAARADVCVTIDQSSDVLSAQEQTAAVLLMARQFEQEGEKVVPSGCTRSYGLSHARLGNTIVVTVTGSGARWEAVALGTDDLPAVYAQIVRSIVTGRPMTGLNVVDRTNVTASQASARRVHTDSTWYARLGYASLFGDRAYGTPALGFGYRAELDSLGIDVSFLNFQFSPSGYYSDSEASAGSWLKLSGLYFLDPRANRTAYFGGGLSYGRSSFGSWNYPMTNQYPYEYHSDWHGDGLQAELTAGYEFARVTSLRLFVQADAVLPFYNTVSETFSRTGPIGRERRYAPSLIVSIGLGK
jgi:hypothetical protein